MTKTRKPPEGGSGGSDAVSAEWTSIWAAGFAAGRWDILSQFPYAVENSIIASDPVWALFEDKESAEDHAALFIEGRAIESSKRFGD